MTRPTRDLYFSKIAMAVADRATCARRRVGCVLVDTRGHILSTGYNGPAAGTTNCIGTDACNAAKSASGSNLDTCRAIHAEQNALLQCKNVFEIETAYVTDSPCLHCIKLLMNTTCKRIVFIREYESCFREVGQLWMSSGSGRVIQEIDQYRLKEAMVDHYDYWADETWPR